MKTSLFTKTYKKEIICGVIISNMISRRVRTQRSFLTFLYEASKKVQKFLINTATKLQLDAFFEIALNLYGGVIPINNQYISKLKKYRPNIRLLISKTVGLKRKRNIILKNIPLISLLLRPIINTLNGK